MSRNFSSKYIEKESSSYFVISAILNLINHPMQICENDNFKISVNYLHEGKILIRKIKG